MFGSGEHNFEGIGRVLRERRTVHDFSQDLPPVKIITQAVDLARWAPNHHRTEPWHFFVLDRDIGCRVADLNAELVSQKKGEKIAVLGPTGSGKSTFIDLLLGLIEPELGGIYIDDVQINKKNMKSYRNIFAFVPQKIFFL